MKRRTMAYAAAAAGAAAWLAFALPAAVSAQSPFPDPNAGLAPDRFGRVSPLIPMQSTEAVHMGLIWKNSVPWYDIGAICWSASDRALLGWKPRSEA